MTKLVELVSAKHQSLKVKKNAGLEAAKVQHSISLRVSEVSQAISSFPVFFTRIEDEEQWSISAMTSLEVNKNIFCSETAWLATYMPNAMRTYPLFLMHSPVDENKHTVGIIEDGPAFSNEEGEALFDASGKPTLYQTRVKSLLDEDIKNNYHTFKFLQKIHELGLVKAIDVKIFYSDNTVSTLKGLHTVDEEKFHALTNDTFEELRLVGYLPPIYAILMSGFQLNNLINRHNSQSDSKKIVQVKMEVPKNLS